jgi:hypothetical protein
VTVTVHGTVYNTIMPIKINGQYGQVSITGSGKINIGPALPAQDALILVVDPQDAIFTTKTSTNPSGVIIPPRLVKGTGSFTTYPENGVVLRLGATVLPTSQPTGGYYAIAYTASAANPINEEVYYIISGSAINHLADNIQDEVTILVWYTGFSVSANYPFSSLNAGVNPRIHLSRGFPRGSNNITRLTQTPNLQENQLIRIGNTFSGGWNTSRAAGSPFETTPYVLQLDSILTQQPGTFTSINNGDGTFSGSISMLYSSRRNTWMNYPYLHRNLPASAFKGREVYATADTWNCVAFTLRKTTNTVTASMYSNGGLLTTQSAATVAITPGSPAAGSTDVDAIEILIDGAGGINTGATWKDAFIFTSSFGGLNPKTFRMFPTKSGNPSDQIVTLGGTNGDVITGGFFYFPSGSDFLQTMINLNDKINSTPTLSSWFTSSFVGIAGQPFAISASANGTTYRTTTSGYKLVYSGSSNVDLIGSLTGGTNKAGTGNFNQPWFIKDISSYKVNTTVQNALTIGALSGDGTRTIGMLGATYVYNRVLTQTEIAQHYDVLKARYGNKKPSDELTAPYSIFNNFYSSSAATGWVEVPPSSSGLLYY